MHIAKEVHEELQTLELSVKQRKMLLSYAALLEAMEEARTLWWPVGTMIKRLSERAAEIEKVKR